MDWVQVYDPLGAAWLSTLMAAVPIVLLLGLLVAGQSAPRAAIAGLAAALVIAIAGFGMPTSAVMEVCVARDGSVRGNPGLPLNRRSGMVQERVRLGDTMRKDS